MNYLDKYNKYNEYKKHITEFGKSDKTNSKKVSNNIIMLEDTLVLDHQGGYYYIKENKYEEIYQFPFLCNL